MKTKRCSNPHLAFPVVIILSLCLQTSANHTGLHLREETWSPTSQNLSGSQGRAEESTESPLDLSFSSQMTALEMQSTLPSSSTTAQNPPSSPAKIQSTLPSLSPTMTQNSTSPGAAATTGGLVKSSKPKSPRTKETCEDNKSLILICFIIIAVLVLICISLLLSTVIVANRMSLLRRAQQGQRRPRSNGHLLATSSLWPTAAGTWQRMPKDTGGTELPMQELQSGRDAVSQRKTEDETAEKLTKAGDNEQESKEPSQPHKPILTNFVVEI